MYGVDPLDESQSPEPVTSQQPPKKKRWRKRTFSRRLTHGAPDKKPSASKETSDPNPQHVPTPQSQVIRKNTIT
jgi:hypothetical protein